MTNQKIDINKRLRKVHRYEFESDSWKEIKMEELKVDDAFLLEQVAGVWKVLEPPFYNEDGVCTVLADPFSLVKLD